MVFQWQTLRDATSLLRRGALSLLLILFSAGQPVSAADVSKLRPGEALVLLPAAAHQSGDGRHWIVPVHAWVYVPQDSHVRRGTIARILKARHDLNVTPASAPFFDLRVNLLLADNKRGRTIVVDVAGTRATLPPTAANGHTRAQVRIPVTASTSDGAIATIRAVLPPSASRAIETSAHMIGPAGLSIISDIDDTVKITHVLDRRRMWEETFYKPFDAVDGMPAAYAKLTATGAPVHYVSSSPWHLAEPLLEFLIAKGLPTASITLKHFRLKDRTSLNILKPGRATKPPEIEAILTSYPGRRFILIGDSGEDDPEVYAQALRRHSKQIEKIYIRNITGAKRDDARFARAFGGLEAERWVLFDDPGAIAAP
jgi:Uncharacterized conserved protein (DUF2183)